MKARINRHELSQYSFLTAQATELELAISEAMVELTELKKYDVNISPVYSGLPSGNEIRDKIAEFLIRLEKDVKHLQSKVKSLNWELKVTKFRLHKINEAINNISNKQLQEIMQLHYIKGHSLVDIAEMKFISYSAAHKCIARYLGEK